MRLCHKRLCNTVRSIDRSQWVVSKNWVLKPILDLDSKDIYGEIWNERVDYKDHSMQYIQLRSLSNDSLVLMTHYSIDFNARSLNSSIVFWVPITSYNQGQGWPKMNHTPSLIKWYFNGSWHIVMKTLLVTTLINPIFNLINMSNTNPRPIEGHPLVSFKKYCPHQVW